METPQGRRGLKMTSGYGFLDVLAGRSTGFDSSWGYHFPVLRENGGAIEQSTSDNRLLRSIVRLIY